LHRDLSNSQHQTNIHKFYTIPYPPSSASQPSQSFFSLPPSTAPTFHPKDPAIHKPLSVTQFLTKKLRWLTLGGQYDWTAKRYPPGQPPAFPPDIAALLKAVFPDMEPEAAIVNLYSPGDTLSMHRDVAEQCDKGLVSVSIGCDAIFVVGLDGLEPLREHADGALEVGCGRDGGADDEGFGTRVVALRLRSGDAVYMAGASRFAWHGVPKIIAGTCPEWLRDWPAEEGVDECGFDAYEGWRGWMDGKRINLNVRQMFE
jgi:alkylated DNA repair protein alkB homolog 1